MSELGISCASQELKSRDVFIAHALASLSLLADVHKPGAAGR